MPKTEVVEPAGDLPAGEREIRMHTRCGYCATGYHSSCRPLTVGPRQQHWYCPCTCPKTPRCLTCGRADVDVVADVGSTAFHTCIDAEDCRAHVVARRHDILGVMLGPFLDRLDRSRTEVKRPIAPSTPRVKPGREPKLCACGCGTMTKGGLYAMGHNARVAGMGKGTGRGAK